MLDKLFKASHRLSEKVFVRTRKLDFSSVILLILRKSMKSVQLLLNELTLQIDTLNSVSSSAFTQARSHLKYTAFIELNQKAVVDVMYSDDSFKQYKGMRILAVDGSKIRLPNTSEIVNEFGAFSYTNGKDKTVLGEHATALCSVLYDILNNVVLDSVLAHSHSYEVDLSLKHLEYTTKDDLLIYDRNYSSFRNISTHISLKRFFVMRCSRSSFKEAQMMFDGEGSDSKIVTINQPKNKKIDSKLPLSVVVRFVRVMLPTGEWEVLATNLFNEDEFPANNFLEIYDLRWGIETFYGVLKNRLGLENFSGKTVESIYQDFYSAIYISGLESILTADVNEELEQKETKNSQKVNHNVSFNIIKNRVLDLLFSKKNSNKLIKELEIIFKTNPVQCRKERKVPRVKTSPTKALDFQKRKKKICY